MRKDNWAICIDLRHFVQGTWASADFGIRQGSWNQATTDTEGQFKFPGIQSYTWIVHYVGLVSA